MSGIGYALITVLCWGTWLSIAQSIPFKNQQIKIFYVAAANLVLASVVFLVQGGQGLTLKVFLLSFVGGLIWAVSGWMAFVATHELGVARATGIWAPINVVVSILWGVILFGEFLSTGSWTMILLILSVLILIAGVLMIIFAKGMHTQKEGNFRIGLLGALGAGVLWGSYFIPGKYAAASAWTTAFPLAVGIFAGSAILVALTREPLRLNHASEYLRVTVSGLLWGIGNYGMLLLVEQIGAGRGFTIAQLGVVINGLMGVYILKDPQPKTRAAWLTLIGCVLASVGGIMLGSLK